MNIPGEAFKAAGGWNMDKYRQHARNDEIAERNAKERTNPVIPDEAVEAAAWVLDPQTMGSGGSLAEKFKAETRAEARKILEVAAPHIEKAAYERGWGAGFRHHKESAK